jgi:hypothetical protein
MFSQILIVNKDDLAPLRLEDQAHAPRPFEAASDALTAYARGVEHQKPAAATLQQLVTDGDLPGGRGMTSQELTVKIRSEAEPSL